MKPLPPSIEDTLITAEREQALLAKGWRLPGPDALGHAAIYLLLAGNIVVTGWATRLQPGWPVEFFTWDPRYRVLLAAGGVRPGRVVPQGWSPQEHGDVPHIPTVAEYAGDVAA